MGQSTALAVAIQTIPFGTAMRRSIPADPRISRTTPRTQKKEGGELMPPKKVWAALVFPNGVSEVFGATRGANRLHWTQKDARVEACRLIDALGKGPVRWEMLDDACAVGKAQGHTVITFSIELPSGLPPPELSVKALPKLTDAERKAHYAA
jgi:hypothetical protein